MRSLQRAAKRPVMVHMVEPGAKQWLEVEHVVGRRVALLLS